MIKIDKNIPVPTGRTSIRPGKYPFASMAVGDSFFINGDKPSRVRNASYGWGRHHGAKFRLSAATEDGTDGVRVWRTE
jgi:hypothetical protein